MRRLLLLTVAFVVAVIFGYWIPAIVRHFARFGSVAHSLARPGFCLVLFALLFASPALRSQFRVSWRWTWVLLIPLVFLGLNTASLFAHPPFFPAVLAAALVLDGLAIGFMEEFLFRGVAFLGEPEASPKATVFLSALVFSLLHLMGLTTGADPHEVQRLVVFAFPAGITFGIIRMATGSIAWPVVLHGLIDATGYLAYPQAAPVGRLGAGLVAFSAVATGVLFFVHPAMKPKRLTMRCS